MAILRPREVPAGVFRAFVDKTPDFAICVLDSTGHIVSWNEGATKMKGYSEREILGAHFSKFFTSADVAARRPHYILQRALADGRFEDEGWRVRKDGTMFWADAVTTPVRGERDEVVGFVKITRDLTTRKNAEEALRHSEEKYRILVESVKDYAIFMLDAAGYVMSWNAGAERLKGYTSKEIIGRHFRTFYPAADRERKHPESELRMALEDGRYEEEGLRVRKDGSTFWASVTITALFDGDRRHIGFAKVTRDLTERKRADEELRERARSYAEINRELDAFSHTVAHDLRSPIRAIEHLSSVLLEQERALTPGGRETLEALHHSSLAMARLVQALLDLSTGHAREPVRRQVDLTLLARDVLEELRRYERDPHAVEVKVQDGLSAFADRHLLRVALGNLLSNALKFTRGTPNAQVEVGIEPTPRGDAFFVRDNGVGFDGSQSARIFEPFTRLVGSNEFEGTGIGLATVARVVKRHGGEVWATSRPGEGATIYFTIPKEAP